MHRYEFLIFYSEKTNTTERGETREAGARLQVKSDAFLCPESKVEGECLDFLNKMGRKRHVSEYLADSGSVSSTSTTKMLEGLLGKI